MGSDDSGTRREWDRVMRKLEAAPIGDRFTALTRLRASIEESLKGQKLQHPEGAHDTTREAIFDDYRRALAVEPTPGLYLDGVVDPTRYRDGPGPRTVFVFKEPHLKKPTEDHAMVDEVLDLVRGKGRKEASAWWTKRVPLFAHAVAHRKRDEAAMLALCLDERPVEHLLQFGFVQLKKTGGAATTHDAIIGVHVARYGWLLRRQLHLLRPKVLVACGKSASPFDHLTNGVLKQECLEGAHGKLHHEELPGPGNRWWRGAWDSDTPFWVLEAFHPRARKSNKELYQTLRRDFLELERLMSA